MRASVRLAGAEPLSVAPLGVGMATVMRAPSLQEQLALLEEAYECGYRYIDVAPLYGMGAAESVLGRFLARHPDVAVGTKVGLIPRRAMRMLRYLRRPLRAMSATQPQHLTRLTARTKETAVRLPLRGAAIEKSVTRSLKALRRERIDVLLLHDVSAHECGGEVLERLCNEVDRGRVATIGFAGSATSIASLLELEPSTDAGFAPRWDSFEVIQSAWSIDAERELPPVRGRLNIRHSVLASSLDRVCALVGPDAVLRERLHAVTGLTIRTRCDVAVLLVALAAHASDGGIVLVGSATPGHLRVLTRAADVSASISDAGTVRRMLRSSRPR